MLPVTRCAVGLLEVAAAAGTMQLSPGATAGMTVGTNIAQPEPAAIATVGIGTEMARGVHLAAASARGDDGRGWGAGGLRARRGGVLTRVAMGLVGEARKGLRGTGVLAGWGDRRGGPLYVCGGAAGPSIKHHQKEAEQNQQHQLVGKKVGYHPGCPPH